ncbi:MAG: bifunctional pyr operon transcriptional regulator/uracil phosphoribosyltransferase PyrR [Candidatus Competibacteraceae bacterium]|nr:bifunctional pyr operon transcriptional regulator/uracil phosphoribosyltransferase PyrR [Candidatus Competibacteraceae bacterium]
MDTKLLLDSRHFNITLDRLCYQLIENHHQFDHTVLIGVQPRGIYLSERIHKRLTEIIGRKDIRHGILDITFFRDDFRRRDEPLVPSATQIDFIIEEKNVVLIDDVLYTGRTIRAALDAILAFGRPRNVELLVLIDRKFSRQLPVQADYIGATVDAITSQKVKVEWAEQEGKDQVILYTPVKS